jgi:hypothetical protein
MNSQTKRVLAVVALIVATGVGAVELSRNSAQADPLLVTGGSEGYAGSRVDGAFQLVSLAPVSDEEFPVAEKGDLPPLGCIGPFRPEVAAECTDVAYEVESEDGEIVETRVGNTSILTRMVEYTMAGF